MARSILHARSLYDHDLVIVHSDALLGLEALGGRMAFPEHGPPMLVSRPVSPPPRPLDPWRDGRMPLLLEAACRVRRGVSAETAVAVSLTGPFTLAAAVGGESSFLALLPRLGARERDLMDCAVESTIRAVNAARGEGLGVMVAEPLVSLLGPSVFVDLIVPSLRRVLAGPDAIVHICGDSSHLLPHLSSLTAGAFSLDQVDLVEASRVVRGHAVVMGGLAPEMVRTGTPECIQRAAADLLWRVGDCFIPCTGCDLVWDTPVANVQAFMRGARSAPAQLPAGEVRPA
jgi:uroporphyrinogen decarboxylase